MRRPVKIDSRFANAEDTARILGVSPSRTRQLVALVDSLLDGNQTKGPKKRLSAAARRRISLAAKNR